MGHCFTCGGNGFADKECPECKREPRNVSLNLDKASNVGDFVKKVNDTMIPAYYQGVFWNRTKIESDNAAKLAKYNELGYDDHLFIRYLDQLDKVNAIFADNRLPHKSAIIIAPAGYGKITFAYSCMQRALSAGFTVAPLLDTCEVKRALILASENVHYKINGYLSYDQYITSDVLFVTVTKLYAHQEAYQVIQELIDRRSRRGLSTFVLSRFSLEAMSKTDKTHSFDAIRKSEVDTFKYAAIISYAERRT